MNAAGLLSRWSFGQEWLTESYLRPAPRQKYNGR